jgi:hypothetical protein
MEMMELLAGVESNFFPTGFGMVQLNKASRFSKAGSFITILSLNL